MDVGKRNERYEAAMLAKYGSAEEVKKKRQEWQAKSRQNPNTKQGGFKKLTPEQRHEISLKGHAKRWGYKGDKDV